MKPMLLLLTLAIAACANQHSSETLVCVLRGEVQYTSTSYSFYTTDGGRVWKSWEGYQYRPSALESCYTRRATAEERAQ